MKEQITDYLIKEGFELVEEIDSKQPYFRFSTSKHLPGFSDALVDDTNRLLIKIGSPDLNTSKLESILEDMADNLDLTSVVIKYSAQNALIAILNF